MPATTTDQQFTAASLSNVTGLSFDVVAGQRCDFKFRGLYRSASLTVGLRIGLAVPNFTMFGARVVIAGFAVDGTDAEFYGNLTTSGDAVVSTAVIAINTDYLFIVEGTLIPSANGTVQLQAGCEVAGTVTVRQGTCGDLTTL
jgi:hypothetical protein